MERIRVRQTGSFGYDLNDDLTKPGLYTIPVPNKNVSDTDAGWVDVDIRRVLMPPETRLHIIMGYDETGESQMWYYNGSQNCFKRVWENGVMGRKKKNQANVVKFLLADSAVSNESTADDIASWFMTL